MTAASLVAYKQTGLPPWVDGNVPTKAVQARGCITWAKTVLLAECVPEDGRVVELYAGVGLEIGKWARAKVSFVSHVDPRPIWLTECESKWTKRNRPFPAEFLCHDPTIEIVPVPSSSADLVTCFDRFESSFRDETACLSFWSNVSAMLKPGGLFLAFCLDSAAAWSACVPESGTESIHEVLRAKGALFTLEIASSRSGHAVYGRTFRLLIEGEDDAQQREASGFVEHRYLVDMPTLLRVARQSGMEMVDCPNMVDFLTEYGEQYRSGLQQFRVFRNPSERNIEKDQRAALALFCVCIFRKVA